MQLLVSQASVENQAGPELIAANIQPHALVTQCNGVIVMALCNGTVGTLHAKICCQAQGNSDDFTGP